MDVSFLTPLAGLVAIAVIVPLVAFGRSEQRVSQVRSLLRLAPPAGRSGRQTVLALAALAALVGIGAAQPVLEDRQERVARTDAQAFFVIDTSRSMLAARGPDEPNRFDRARSAARRLRGAFRDVPVGVASLTDRVLPHVFPTPNTDSFDSVIRHSIGVDRPPSDAGGNARVSTLNATTVVPTRNFFSVGRRRLLVLFTDAETVALNRPALEDAFAESGLETILIRFGDTGERIFRPDGIEESYVPDPRSGALADEYARVVDGLAFDEGELGEATDAARSALGKGRTSVRVESVDVHPLGPFVFLAALAPLSFLLWRRNLA